MVLNFTVLCVIFNKILERLLDLIPARTLDYIKHANYLISSEY
jgi:hypothetical protein